MLRWLGLLFFFATSLFAEPAADLARAIRENSFDRDECYRVRDLTLVREDIRIYLTDGHLIFSKPVAGRRIAAVFVADVEGGDAEVLLMPPDRAERRSLASYIDTPNLDEHFRSALFLFTGDDYERLTAQFPKNPANKKAPELAPLLDEQWRPVLRNLAESYQIRLTLDLLTARRGPGLFEALFDTPRRGNFDVSFDPINSEQILAGQLTTRDDRVFFNIWTSFQAKSYRQHPAARHYDVTPSDYRIDATLRPDLALDVVTRVKITPTTDGLAATAFDIAAPMEVSEVKVDGKPAEVLERESLRQNATRRGNNLFLVVPPEPLRAGREYEFEFHHSGKVILTAGDRVFYVAARGNWYPMHGDQFTTYEMTFRYPTDLELVSAGEVVEDKTEGDLRITRRRTSSPIRVAAFNLGDYAHARVERGGYTIDVCANRALEKALEPKPAPPPPVLINPPNIRMRRPDLMQSEVTPAAPDPMARLKQLATDVAASMEFMASKFGPPTLPHITVSPIPGRFGQGFPGLIYLSTLSYLNKVPGTATAGAQNATTFFQDMLQAHEVAHQWWGNRVVAPTYRDYWLLEALSNYSALLYLEKTRGEREAERMLDSYRTDLLAKGDGGQTVESSGPIVLGARLESSLEPRAWVAITYGKGSWILQMLRRRLGDTQFFALLAETSKRYDRRDLTTDAFREMAAKYLPPKSEDPKLESFFDQWVYGTGIPSLSFSYTVKGKAPALRLTGTLTQSGVDDDFSALVPVEIQTGKGRIVRWVSSGSTPATFTLSLTQMPVKVTMDPRHGVLRK
jgi:hypothetical protein